MPQSCESNRTQFARAASPDGQTTERSGFWGVIADLFRAVTARASNASSLTGPSGHAATRFQAGTVGGMSMRARFSGPLRLVFQAERRAAGAEHPTVEAPPVQIVELTVYADDSVAFGRLALTADRVTDLMNERTEFEFVDTLLEGLDDGRGLLVTSVVVARDEILVVAVAGPRGDPARRTRTRPVPVELRVGPYDVSGNIHVVPGTDPIMGFRRRRVMVPLTEATIEFDAPEGRRHSRYGTILVNRDLTDWIAPAERSDVRPPELIQELQGVGLAKDFTPQMQAHEA
jgi:hypothetical protein